MIKGIVTNNWFIGISCSLVAGIVLLYFPEIRKKIKRHLLFIFNAPDHIEKLEKKLKDLETLKIVSDKVYRDLGLVWYFGQDMNSGPYCERCWSKDGLWTLIDCRFSGDKVYFYCGNDGKTFGPAKQLDFIIVTQRVTNLRFDDKTSLNKKAEA